MTYKKELSNISLLARIDEDTVIHSHVWIGAGVSIGSGCKVQAFAYLPPGVTLEDDVFVGPNVTFLNDKYPPSDVWSETLVKSGASIGGGSTILPGITIGKEAVIGAGSVVTKSVPDGEKWYGNPATCA